MIGAPLHFTLGRAAFRRRCANRPPTPCGRMDCARSWLPFVDAVTHSLTQRLSGLPYHLEEGADDDHTDGDLGALGILRAAIDAAWDRWPEWAVFTPPTQR